MSDNVIIRTENLMKTYGGNGVFVNALSRVNIRIMSRRITAIVGASGSGKSTLLHMLGGIDIPSGGSVYFNEEEGKPPVSLYAMSRNELARFRGKNYGFVFQNYALLPVLTAWENVMLPSVYSDEDFDRDYAERLFEKLGLSGRRDLDEKNGHELLELLISLRDESNTTVVMVTHDPSIAAKADNVITMRDGEVVSVK